MKPRNRLQLKKDLSRHLRAGHPWVWRDALAPASLPTGAIVDVHAASGGFLGRGLYDARSPIAVRIFTLDPKEEIDAAFIHRRVQEALEARRGAIDPAETDAFRLVNGEGDFLPGLVVDLYAGTAIVRFDGDAARTLSAPLTTAVLDATRALGVTRVYERSRGAKGQVLAGDEPPEIIEIRECGVRFGVDVKHGQKTGTFLDQRENRRALRRYAGGLEVGNLFCYTGGFSVQAALAGATRVTSVDVAPAALDGAKQNFSRNGIDPARHLFACADVFAWLAEARAKSRRYGLLVVDPPSFAPSEKSLEKALGAYRDLFVASLGIVEPGGLLAASSCSSHVDQDDFIGTLRDAAARAQRACRILEIFGQPADHPSLPAFKEGRYLKFVLLRVR